MSMRRRPGPGARAAGPSEADSPGAGPGAEPVCAVCGRPIPPGARQSRHHLTPRLKGGARRGTVLLHQICHSAIHARFSEAELARRLSDLDSLRAEPSIARFLDWVRTRPPGFHAPTRRAAAKTGPRRGRRA